MRMTLTLRLSPRVALASAFLYALPACSRPGGTPAPAATVLEAATPLARAPAARPQADPPGSPRGRFEHAGVTAELAAFPAAAHPGRKPGELRAGDDVTFRFRLADAATGAPIANARPAAWVVRYDAAQDDPPALARQVGKLVQGDRLAPPEADLNRYYVLTLNDDATLSVVDPRFSFGGTRLLALVTLPGVGVDWALTPDGRRLFVSVPEADRVVAIDTVGWKILGDIEGVRRPTRLALQADGHALWVASGEDRQGGGVAVIDANSLRVAATIPTGRGPHDLALGRDDLHAYVTNRGSGTVSVLDARRRAKLADVPTGPAPAAVAYSAAAGSAYVADAEAGTVSAVAADPPAVVARVDLGAGAGAIRFAPGTAIALVTVPDRREVAVVDAADHRILRRVDLDGTPGPIAATDRMAYFTRAGSPMVRLLPLEGLASAGRPATVVDVPGGRAPLGGGRSPALAATIVPTPEAGTVLIANPADKAVYYYQEGMSAPLGSFANDGREPRAVLALDRSLRATGPGTYEVAARLPRAGRFGVALLIDRPRLVHRFELPVAEDPDHPATPPSAEVEALADEAPPTAAAPYRFRFRVHRPGSAGPAADLTGLRVLAHLPGRWQGRSPAVAGAEPGTYAAEFTPPEAGLYFFYIEGPAGRLRPRGAGALCRDVRGRP